MATRSAAGERRSWPLLTPGPPSPPPAPAVESEDAAGAQAVESAVAEGGAGAGTRAHRPPSRLDVVAVVETPGSSPGLGARPGTNQGRAPPLVVVEAPVEAGPLQKCQKNTMTTWLGSSLGCTGGRCCLRGVGTPQYFRRPR